MQKKNIFFALFLHKLSATNNLRQILPSNSFWCLGSNLQNNISFNKYLLTPLCLNCDGLESEVTVAEWVDFDFWWSCIEKLECATSLQQGHWHEVGPGHG